MMLVMIWSLRACIQLILYIEASKPMIIIIIIIYSFGKQRSSKEKGKTKKS